MTLHSDQVVFARYVALLIQRAEATGFEVVLGECERPDWVAFTGHALKPGTYAYPSFHSKCLAIDIKLFRGGNYLTLTQDYEPLGVYWESLDPNCTWGGRFKRSDGSHFSYGER